jgi:hypothetical protein
MSFESSRSSFFPWLPLIESSSPSDRFGEGRRGPSLRRNKGSVKVESEAGGCTGLRAMMVLLPLQVHLQKEVAEAMK